MRGLASRARVAALAAALAAAAWAAAPDPSRAQAITPMRGQVSAFGEEFALRVVARNPFPGSMGIEMRAYDHAFRPIEARFSRGSFVLGTGKTRRVTALIPFDGHAVRFVRVCAEAVALRAATQNIRTRVCGKFRAQRR